MRFRKPDGSHAKLTLGTFDLSGKEGEPVLGAPLTLAGARALAAEVHRQRAAGIDVASRHVAARRERAAVADTCFGSVARRFIEEHAMKNRSWRANTARVLGLDYPRDGGNPALIKGGLADRWRERPVAEIESGDVYGAIAEAIRTGIPGLEKRVAGASDARGRALAAALGKLFSWAVAHRLIALSPAAGVFKTRPPQARDRVLSTSELRLLWAACDQTGYPFGVVAKLLLVTGQRRAEVAGMRWSELSEDYAVWNIPAQRTKNARPHTVWLPPAARGLVASVPRCDGVDLLFTFTHQTAVSGFSKAKAQIDATMRKIANKEVQAWRVHDLRRTAATGMGELGIAPHVIELTLNHISGHRSAVAGVYNRSVMAPERKAALERWAKYVVGIVTEQRRPGDARTRSHGSHGG
jgi:integrase